MHDAQKSEQELCDIDKNYKMWYPSPVINSNGQGCPWVEILIGEGYLILGSESGCYISYRRNKVN